MPAQGHKVDFDVVFARITKIQEYWCPEQQECLKQCKPMITPDTVEKAKLVATTSTPKAFLIGRQQHINDIMSSQPDKYTTCTNMFDCADWTLCHNNVFMATLICSMVNMQATTYLVHEDEFTPITCKTTENICKIRHDTVTFLELLQLYNYDKGWDVMKLQCNGSETMFKKHLLALSMVKGGQCTQIQNYLNVGADPIPLEDNVATSGGRAKRHAKPRAKQDRTHKGTK